MLMVMEFKFEIDSIVYIRTDIENIPYQVTHYLVRKAETVYVLNSAVKGPAQAFEGELGSSPNPEYM